MLSFFQSSTDENTVAVLQAATNKLHEESHRYQEELAKVQAELEVLKEAKPTSESEDEAWAKVVDLEQKVASLEDELASLKAGNPAIQRDAADEILKLEQQSKDSTVTAVDLGIKVCEMEQSLAECQARETALQVRLTQRDAQLTERDAQVAYLTPFKTGSTQIQSQLAEKESQVGKLQVDVLKLQEDFNAEKLELGSQNKLLEQSQSQLAEKESQVGKLQMDVMKLQADLNAEKIELGSRNKLLEQTQSWLAARDAVVASLQGSLSEVQSSPVWRAMNPGKLPISAKELEAPSLPISAVDILSERFKSKVADEPCAPVVVECSFVPTHIPTEAPATDVPVFKIDPQPTYIAPVAVEPSAPALAQASPVKVDFTVGSCGTTMGVGLLVGEPVGTSPVGLSSSVAAALSLDALPMAPTTGPVAHGTSVDLKFAPFAAKMQAEGLGPACVLAFKASFTKLVEGSTGMISESSIQPVTSLPHLNDIKAGKYIQGHCDASLLAATACLKLNGGLGTSMGLEKAKSLLQVKDGLSFLDYTAKQILHLRQTHHAQVKFLLMNSFSTSEDTKAALAKYPELGAEEIMQNKVPKVDATSLRPASWSASPSLEWCPPGHGDVYAALAGSGALDRLLASGTRYLFVSNSDNLGATLDLDVLSYFASQEDMPLMLEVCERTESDKKGGHLALGSGGGLLLRESAQCADEDKPSFENIMLHKFFNTNNMWLRLDKLKEQLESTGGHMPLPMIKNAKTVDPRDKSSPKVFQLETAMGAAIESFPAAGALVVPRSRFAPVKTCADLLVLRSDAYKVEPDWTLQLAPKGRTSPPKVSFLDSNYTLVDQIEKAFGSSAPSLINCTSLEIKGVFQVDEASQFEGDVKLYNYGTEASRLDPGKYTGLVTKI
mmetsp:Transcript_21433/g.29779  ORF Transcript_21433/g.29779 Transcript_21433/m.29779 type:complete len:893 (+) Transcript_21433:46-2724(+)|eukprot:CAMPEP_0196583278 /NCGR_PEP_ID=MMETSP1081-20130531/42805_1 /TAXON_ID=36882 /ORGANISM="Pyramimonas amylifera, Strain CCMP720" /LENGTH=892 /DNA_ID=CAMNT_0041904109 /DNA_START=39 /DNA_END=2717 /DNA_ORIENTATION=+